MAPPLIVAATFILFAVLHSLTISDRFKRWIAGLAGDEWMRRWYRAVYALLSAVTTVVAVYVFFAQPETFIYRPDWHVLLFFHLVQFFGLWLVIVSVKRAGIGDFLGLRQMHERGVEGEAQSDMEGKPRVLWTSGIYGLVRHPMYLGGILAFLPEPNISVNCLVLRVLASAYFVYGAVVEEKRCIKAFGEEYLDYKEHVPMFNIVAGLVRAYKRQRPR